MGLRLYRAAAWLCVACGAAVLAREALHRSVGGVVLGRYSVGRAVLLAAGGAVLLALVVLAALPRARAERLAARIGRTLRFLAPRLAVAAFGLAVLFLAAEGVVRAVGGLGCHPSIDTIKTDVRGNPYRTNGHGYRDDDREMAKPPGTFRIVALGDSVTWGQGVPEEETWGRRLPGALAARGGRPVELINAGRIGWDTERERKELEAYGLRFSPDLVLLNFVGNDADWWDPGYYELKRPVPALVEPLFGWSCFYKFVKRSYNGLLVAAGVMPTYAEHQRKVLSPGSAGWRRCRGELEKIVALSRGRGARVAAVIWAGLSDEEPHPMAECHAMVARAFAEMQVPVLDLDPVFAPLPALSLQVLPEDPHPNGEACRLAADAMAAFLVDRGLVPRAP